MFKICTSVESWTDADPRNVAIIHCLTGKGRTAVIIACILTWMGKAIHAIISGNHDEKYK